MPAAIIAAVVMHKGHLADSLINLVLMLMTVEIAGFRRVPNDQSRRQFTTESAITMFGQESTDGVVLTKTDGEIKRLGGFLRAIELL